MVMRVFLSVALLLTAGLALPTSRPAMAGLYAGVPTADTAPQGHLLQLADSRGYYHCHNMPRRVRCHKNGRLPVNWPPHSNTPSKSSLRDLRTDKVAEQSRAYQNGASCRR